MYNTCRIINAERQEEEMTRRVSGTKQMTQKKSKRLEDLFRPPCDILFLGSFMQARDHAKTLNRWLLVNVQNPQEFSCQVLNRDVWSNEHIQEIVKDHFILWQVCHTRMSYHVPFCSSSSASSSYIFLLLIRSYLTLRMENVI